MPLKIIRQDHFELLGEGYVLLTAPHAPSPNADLHTGQIVEDAALVSRCFAVVGKVSREYVDLNRVQAAETELRKSIDMIVGEYGIRYILDVNGKKEPGVDIGTGNGETASGPTTDLVRVRLSQDFPVKVNEQRMGLKPGSVITTYAKKGPQDEFILEALQIGFGYEERHNDRDKVVSGIAMLVALINGKQGLAETDRVKAA